MVAGWGRVGGFYNKNGILRERERERGALRQLTYTGEKEERAFSVFKMKFLAVKLSRDG